MPGTRATDQGKTTGSAFHPEELPGPPLHGPARLPLWNPTSSSARSTMSLPPQSFLKVGRPKRPASPRPGQGLGSKFRGAGVQGLGSLRERRLRDTTAVRAQGGRGVPPVPRPDRAGCRRGHLQRTPALRPFQALRPGFPFCAQAVQGPGTAACRAPPPSTGSNTPNVTVSAPSFTPPEAPHSSLQPPAPHGGPAPF